MSVRFLSLCFHLMFSSLSFAQAPLKSDALKLWEKRDVKESLEQSLAKFEQYHIKNPQDIEPLQYLARGYFLLADNHIEDDDEKMKHFKKAREFGTTGLATNPEFKKIYEKEKDYEKAVAPLTKKEAETLLWTATSLGKWAKLNGIMSSIGYKNQIIAMVKKVEALDPHAFHAAVPRYWGSFYTVAPGIAGGDMKKGKKYFEDAMTQAPDYLTTNLLYAELYLVKADKEKEFKEVLEKVIKSSDGPMDIGPENRLAKKKAQVLLGKTKELF